MNRSDWWPRFQACVESLSLERLEDLGQFYAPQARFQDPFQTVVGRPAILQCYRAMFGGLHQPGFSNLEMASQGPDGPVAVRWHFRFAVHARAEARGIPGTSWLRFDPDGLILLHEDHWDASLLIDAFPLVGRVTQLVKKKIARHAQSH